MRGASTARKVLHWRLTVRWSTSWKATAQFSVTTEAISILKAAPGATFMSWLINPLRCISDMVQRQDGPNGCL